MGSRRDVPRRTVLGGAVAGMAMGTAAGPAAAQPHDRPGAEHQTGPVRLPCPRRRARWPPTPVASRPGGVSSPTPTRSGVPCPRPGRRAPSSATGSSAPASTPNRARTRCASPSSTARSRTTGPSSAPPSVWRGCPSDTSPWNRSAPSRACRLATRWVRVFSEAGARCVLRTGIDGPVDVRDGAGRPLEWVSLDNGDLHIELSRGQEAWVYPRGTRPTPVVRPVTPNAPAERWGLPGAP